MENSLKIFHLLTKTFWYHGKQTEFKPDPNLKQVDPIRLSFAPVLFGCSSAFEQFRIVVIYAEVKISLLWNSPLGGCDEHPWTSGSFTRADGWPADIKTAGSWTRFDPYHTIFMDVKPICGSSTMGRYTPISKSWKPRASRRQPGWPVEYWDILNKLT